MSIKPETIKALADLVQTMEGKETPFVLCVVNPERESVSIGSNIPSRDGLGALGRWMGGIIEKTIDENSVAYAAREAAGLGPWTEIGYDSCTFHTGDGNSNPPHIEPQGWDGPYMVAPRRKKTS